MLVAHFCCLARQIYHPLLVTALGSSIFSHAEPKVERNARRLVAKLTEGSFDVSKVRSAGTLELHTPAVELRARCLATVAELWAAMAQPI